jgi:hypothetical protein
MKYIEMRIKLKDEVDPETANELGEKYKDMIYDEESAMALIYSTESNIVDVTYEVINESIVDGSIKHENTKTSKG